MGRIVELPPIKPRSARHQGLRKLSPDLISKARDETATQVTRIGLTFLGTTAFCLLTLLSSPDSALLGGSEKIIVPLAGPVSFSGFMLLGPAVLIVLRAYLQIYVEHSDRLDRVARSASVVRAPTLPLLAPQRGGSSGRGLLKNPLIRVVSALTFYMLLPVAMMLFVWKAAVFPRWGAGLVSVAVGVIAWHIMLLSSKLSWRMKWLLSVRAAIIAGAIIAGAVMLGFELPPRPFDLFHANLSGQSLPWENLSKAKLPSANLSGANLAFANLTDANLVDADLSGAKLFGADLTGASLFRANLTGARLNGANLTRAWLNGADLTGAKLKGAKLRGANLRRSVAEQSDTDLSGADLSGADLSGAKLRHAKGLTDTQLHEACGNANTELPEPEGFTPLQPCTTD
jgi:uncharacterized protein YjbI with pentapeptide repeats